MSNGQHNQYNLLSDAYHNDGKAMCELNEIQRQSVAAFIADKRISFTNVERCVICKDTDFSIIAEKDQFGIPLETAICNHCGLVFSTRQLSAEGAKIFYDEYYRKIYEGVPAPTLDHGFYKRLYGGRVPKVPQFIRQNSTVLELGCGGGWNLMPYLKRGIRHVGFDHDHNMVKFGRERYGLNLREGGLEAAQVEGIRADFIIISHLLEHVNDPVEFLKGVLTVLAKGGLVRITVPCLDCLAYFGGSGIGYTLGMALQNAHNYTFSENALQKVILSAGFSPVVQVRGFCLAGASPNGVDHGTYGRDGVNHTMRVLASSERWGETKRWINKISPEFIRAVLPYLHLLTRPWAVMRYLYVFNQKEI